MRKFILSAILGFVLASSHSALGFDGFRQGFVLGLGAGLGGVHNDLSIGTEKKFAGMIDSLIGYGISNKFAIHYTHKSFWYDSDGELMASAIVGIGFTYFTTEKAPATFITGVIGSHLIYPASFFKDPCELTSGLGIGIGVGREVSKNWIVGIDVFWGRAKSDSNIFGSNLFGFGAHVSHLFY